MSYFNTKEDFYIANARAAGAVLKYTFPLVFIPVLRILNKIFHDIQHTRNIAENINRYSSHKILASSLILFSGIHTIAHLLHRHSFDKTMITGLVMLFLILILIISIYFSRRAHSKVNYYILFILPHQFAWWGLTLIFAFHTPDMRLLIISIIIFAVFSLDRIIEWCKSTTTYVEDIKQIHPGLIVISLKKPNNYRSNPGDYAILALPWFTYFFNAIHPFTIADNNELLTFIISKNGSWTERLISTVKIGSKIRISPSFPSLQSLQDYNKIQDKSLALVTTGSGMSMTAAFLSHVNFVKYLAIYHCAKDIREAEYLLQLITSFGISPDLIQFNITSNNVTESWNEQFPTPNIRSTVLLKNKRFDPYTSLKDFKGHIFYCGNRFLANDIRNICSEDKGKILHIEYF